jgi:hypothetical protein
MIDENLPSRCLARYPALTNVSVFYWKASKESVKHDATIYLAQYGNEPVPAYTLRYPDPSSADSRNRYAAALYDCYNPDILFGEVLLVPQWAQAQLPPEELRKNGGVPPKPEPALPHECAIQLYNPDQQVALTHTPSKWNASETWEFELPQQTFRQPSASALDRGQNDPTMLDATPTIPLKWKRESKLSKELTLFFAGKQRNPDGSKKKHKEPDIPIAFFKNLREITIYEPNLSRVEVEDPKGLEVIVLLGATIIRDVYHGTLQHAFNIADSPHRRSSADNKPAYALLPAATFNKPATTFNKPAYAPPPAATLNKPPSNAPPPQPSPYYPNSSGLPPQPSPYYPNSSGLPPSPQPPSGGFSHAAPPTDPRSEWEIEAETARLRAAAEAESKAAAKERRKQDKKSEHTARQIAEEEERAARARQAAIDEETERLRKAYAAEQARLLSPPLPPLPPRPSSANDAKSAKEREKEARRREKEEKKWKDKHGHKPYGAVPSVPSDNFLQAPPQMGAGWMPGPHRPASATGFAPGQGYGPTGPGGPGWSGGGGPGWGGGSGGGPSYSSGNPWNRHSGPYAPSIAPTLGGGQGGGLRPVPPQQSSGLFGGLFGGGGGGGGRNRSASDACDRRLVTKRSSIN